MMRIPAGSVAGLLETARASGCLPLAGVGGDRSISFVFGQKAEQEIGSLAGLRRRADDGGCVGVRLDVR